MVPYAILVHEAGHTVVARSLGLDGMGYEQTEEHFAALINHSPDPRVWKEIAAGGAAAEIAVFGEIVSRTAALRGDLQELYPFRNWKEFYRTAQRWAVKIDLEALREEISWARECFEALSDSP